MTTPDPVRTIPPGDAGGLSDDKPMTDEQATKLRRLANEADEPVDGNFSEVQAQKRIAALEEMLGR